MAPKTRDSAFNLTNNEKEGCLFVTLNMLVEWNKSRCAGIYPASRGTGVSSSDERSAQPHPSTDVSSLLHLPSQGLFPRHSWQRRIHTEVNGQYTHQRHAGIVLTTGSSSSSCTKHRLTETPHQVRPSSSVLTGDRSD